MRKLMFVCVVSFGLAFWGCSKPVEKSPNVDAQGHHAADGHNHSADDGHNHSVDDGHGHSADDGHNHGAEAGENKSAGHDVDGWCVEHGLPEAVCSMCNSKVAAEFKKSGDWCKKHNRAESQCFVCDPNRQQKFIAQYEAQYGKKPPK